MHWEETERCSWDNWQSLWTSRFGYFGYKRCANILRKEERSFTLFMETCKPSTRSKAEAWKTWALLLSWMGAWRIWIFRWERFLLRLFLFKPSQRRICGRRWVNLEECMALRRITSVEIKYQRSFDDHERYRRKVVMPPWHILEGTFAFTPTRLLPSYSEGDAKIKHEIDSLLSMSRGFQR